MASRCGAAKFMVPGIDRQEPIVEPASSMNGSRAPAPVPSADPVTSARTVDTVYSDPADTIWIRAAEKLGWKVVRSAEVYASYDGAGTLTLSDASDFDPDDSLAQMIFHEICHALVAGPGAETRPDWGLSNTDDRDLTLEYACHRLQAALSGPYGLRSFMAVTTVWRPYWDALPADPLWELPESHPKYKRDPAIEIARHAFHRAEREPFRSVISEALAATAAIARAVRPHAPAGSLWARTQGHHLSGFLLGDPSKRCGTCAWAVPSGAAKIRCRQADRSKVIVEGVTRVSRFLPTELACERWEPALDSSSCGTCGACCREGFDLVQLRPRDLFKKQHPELVRTSAAGDYVPRPNGTCVALQGDGSKAKPYRCRHYDARPRSCADFAVLGDACLEARRRVGLSR